MKNPEASILNIKGQTRFVDDLTESVDCLQAAVRLSESGHGRILSISAEKALALDPSVMVITAKDLPGENQIGTNKDDEPVLPEDEWEYWGQPLVLVLAKTRSLARKAAAAVEIRSEALPVVVDPREAAKSGDLIMPSSTACCGDTAAAFAKCACVVSGRVDSGGQEHVYLETQGCWAEVREGGKVFVISSTQAPTGVQRAIARALGLPMNMVEVEARRLGGGFGGKEEQASYWACLAALGAWISHRPVKLYLNRREDMRATGKRHPYSTDFRIGADAEGHILAFEADYFQNSGCTCDLSPAILSRTLLHATGAYHIPNVRVTGYMCRTNLPSFTAFRGFGAPQAFFVIESAIDLLANTMRRDTVEIQRANLIAEGDISHYGMPMVNVRAKEAFDAAVADADWPGLKAGIDTFNATHTMEKKGAAFLPLCFGISFTKLSLNQAGALVHVYTDGSVLVSTGAVEMGQQVSRKIALVAARTFGLSVDKIRVERTSTLTVANTVPTAASTGADMNGMATQIACREIRTRLCAKAAALLGVAPGSIEFQDGAVYAAGRRTELGWNALVTAANDARIDLSAHAFYATPNLSFDMKRQWGSPFAYHVYGTACVVARVDLVHCTYRLESASIVHDAGHSLDQAIDLGQIEGGFAQGLGWALLEDLRFGDDGRPLSDTLSTYKVPNADFLPESTRVRFLPGIDNSAAPFNSKAIGEPPLQYGIAGYFAVLNALRAARPDGPAYYSAPLTPEKLENYLDGAIRC